MKLCVQFLRRTALASLAAVAGLALAAHAQPQKTNAAAKITGAAIASKDAAPAEVEIPKSVFVIPDKPADGRDPLFPRSSYVYGSPPPVATKTNGVAAPRAELVLGGVSGTEDNPLAIINNVTFGVGDSLEVTSGTRRFRIRCLEINFKTGTVVVQIGSERRVLVFRQGK